MAPMTARRLRVEGSSLRCLDCLSVVPAGAIESHRCREREDFLAEAVEALAEGDNARALSLLADYRRRAEADGLRTWTTS